MTYFLDAFVNVEYIRSTLSIISRFWNLSSLSLICSLWIECSLPFFSSRAGYSLSLLDLADVSLVAMYKMADVAWISMWQITFQCQNPMFDSTSTPNLIHIFLWYDNSGQQKRLTNKKKCFIWEKKCFNRDESRIDRIWTFPFFLHYNAKAV